MSVLLRPTKPADLGAVVGEPLPYRIKAFTAILQPSPPEPLSKGQGPSTSAQEGETILGIGGIAFPPGGPVIAFVQQAPEAKRYPVAFHRAGLMAMRMIRASGLAEVVATCDEDYPAAVRWLKRLGFRQADMQKIPGKLVWFWNP